MNRTTLPALAVAAAAFIASPLPASATTTLLDFSGNICGAAGNGSCGNYSEIGQNYGDSALADVSYRSITTSTGLTYEPYLKWWDTYGDLTGMVWGGGGSVGYTSEIVITPAAGYEVSLTGFDLATYLGRSASTPITIASVGGTSIYSGSPTTDWPTHNSLAINSAYFADGIVLRWGPDGYDVGLDNILFDVRAAAVSAVPEPSTWAMMILGFGVIGGLMLKKRRQTPGLHFA